MPDAPRLGSAEHPHDYSHLSSLHVGIVAELPENALRLYGFLPFIPEDHDFVLLRDGYGGSTRYQVRIVERKYDGTRMWFAEADFRPRTHATPTTETAR